MVDAVQRLGFRGLLGKVHRFRGMRLHAEGQFVALHAGGQLGMVGLLFLVPAVELGQQVELAAAVHGLVALAGLEVGHRRTAAAKQHALVLGRDEPRTPVGRSAIGRADVENDKAGQIVVGAAQAVGDPGADAGETVANEPRVHLQGGRRVGGGVGLHAADDCQVIDTTSYAWEERGNGNPRAAGRRKLPGRAEEFARLRLGARVALLG